MVIDERTKHRLIGFAVILSLAAIFIPAILKKSSQHVDKELGMYMHMPPKPAKPRIVVTNKSEVFQTVKVAHVELPLPDISKKKAEEVQAYAKKMEQALLDASLTQTLEPKSQASTLPVVPILHTKPLPVWVTKKKPVVKITKKTVISKVKTVHKKNISLRQTKTEKYAVQLAAFSSKNNAQALLNRLRTKGYVGKISHTKKSQGEQYKVFVGNGTDKTRALQLKNQLATALQIKGFVVNTQVG